ncbi:MAG: SpoIVB peptidase S55 domain-containing protein [Peptostreptococcaceae bacterium]
MYNKKKNAAIFGSVILFFMSIATYNIFQSKEKNIEVTNISEMKKYVYPLGNIVGIKATTDGVLVVGYEDDSVEYVGGLKVGDNIIKINDEKINSIDDVATILNNIKKNFVKVTFERNNEYNTENIKIKKDNGTAKLGVWVRDKISGIGTMTFYDPENSKFSGIGHAITDVDTNKLLKIKQGEIYESTAIEIIKGTENRVGQIKGEFNTKNPIGKFYNNSNFGISGEMLSEKNKDVQLIEVAEKKDVKLGKASILFEDKYGNIASYNIKITEIINDSKNDRDLVIEVVDEKLIEYTGGIVQGMSGAPIIQNNKIIGAITHVFKDDYKKGYGIFVDEMIELDKTY